MAHEPDVDGLLWEALQQPAEARAAFLDARCANDDVRFVLDALLRESDDSDPFLKPGGAFDGPLWEEMLATPCELEIGTRLGPYEIQGPIGAGGMGDVYRAHDTRLGRDVAIKVLPQSGAETASTLARFEREARAVAALTHPNILNVYDVGTEDDVHFVVMELLEGETLGQRLAGGASLPVSKAIEYGVQIANGLAAAHARGIVHRDLKPDNIFITRDGRVKILDFGIALYEEARAVEGQANGAPITRTGVLVGTVGYVSPEQLRGEPATPRSDVFAFGVLMHEMLTGIHPFKRATMADTHAAILREDPPSLGRSGHSLAPSAARLIERCLEKQPGDRPEAARDLALFLEATATVAEPAAARGGLEPAIVRRLRTRVLVLSCGLLLLLIATTWGYVRVTANRAVGEVIEADLARGERVVRRAHAEQFARLGLTARLVASFPELKALFATDPATIQDFLVGYQQRIPDAPLLIALGREGAVLARTDDARGATMDAGEEWVGALVGTRSEGAIVEVGGRPFAAVAVASEAGGTVFGYLVAAEAIGQAFAQAVSDATQDEVVMLSATDVLASTLRSAQTPWRSLDAWHADGRRADRSIDVQIGTQRFAAREVMLATTPAVSAIIVRSRDDAIGPYLRIQRGLIVIGLLAVAAVALGGVWFSRVITALADR